jgi:hypothetical protein
VIERRQIICLLCGRQEEIRHGEHVFPRWVSRLLADRSGGWINREGNTREDIDVLLDVCEGCNGRLNKRFEQPAQATLTPLIAYDGNPHTLNAAERLSVARWLVKTCFLARVAAIEVEPIPHLQKQWLMNHERPGPVPGTAVWLGQWRELDVTEHLPALAEEPFPIPGPQANRYMALRVGDVAALVIMEISNLAVLPPSGPNLTRIWPEPEITAADQGELVDSGGLDLDVSFPPVVTISGVELESFGFQMCFP